MIFDFTNFINDINDNEVPVIPLDFTEEEIKEAKDFAYASVYKNYIGSEDKQARLQMPYSFKVIMLMTLISSFNSKVDEIKKRKKSL